MPGNAKRLRPAAVLLLPLCLVRAQEALPDKQTLGSLTPPFSMVPGADISPNQNRGVTDVKRVQVKTAVECAQQCGGNSECDFATWMGENPSWKQPTNCLLRGVGENVQACDVTKLTNSPNTYMMVATDRECGSLALDETQAEIAAKREPAHPDTDHDGTPDVQTLDAATTTADAGTTPLPQPTTTTHNLRALLQAQSAVQDDGTGRGPDTDKDGTPDLEDYDDDNDQIPDDQDMDDDGDGEPDDPDTASAQDYDADADGTPDWQDDDDDDDGVPDVEDDDDDGDGVPDDDDDEPGFDSDGDGRPDWQDADDDDDGIPDTEDTDDDGDEIPDDQEANGDYDTDGDGTRDSEDDDDDGDGTPDAQDPDDDGDGIPDEQDVPPDDDNDADDDGLYDWDDPDDDNDGTPDEDDYDDDNDGTPDAQEAVRRRPAQQVQAEASGAGRTAAHVAAALVALAVVLL